MYIFLNTFEYFSFAPLLVCEFTSPRCLIAYVHSIDLADIYTRHTSPRAHTHACTHTCMHTHKQACKLNVYSVMHINEFGRGFNSFSFDIIPCVSHGLHACVYVELIVIDARTAWWFNLYAQLWVCWRVHGQSAMFPCPHSNIQAITCAFFSMYIHPSIYIHMHLYIRT